MINKNEKIGKKNPSLNGWVGRIKKMGSLMFFDLILENGEKIQIIVNNKEKIKDILKTVKYGDLINVCGQKKQKETTDKNKKIESEILLEKLTLINKTQKMPFEIRDDIELKEDNRFRYRYLDLRRSKIKNIILMKNEFFNYIRNFLYKKKFIEIETPILSQSSPEGAKTFVVPSNLKEKFYTLPQSPQIFKQILMIGGFKNYYQIAKTFRNEDSRSNRQPEFLQLDIEMSFANQKYLFKLIEEMLIGFLTKFIKVKNEFIKFEKISFEECINYYGTDKPDLRNPLKIKSFKEKVFEEKEGLVEKGIYYQDVLNFDKEKFLEIIEEVEINDFIIFEKKNSNEFKLILKNNSKEQEKNKLNFEINLENGFYIIIRSEIGKIDKISSKIRKLFDDFFIGNNSEKEKEYRFVWITDWPLFEYNYEENKINSFRHPFTLPKEEHLSYLNSKNEKIFQIKAEAYDLVCNGEEIASGSLRIYKKELQEKIFELLGFNKEEMEKHFGYFLNALDFAAPPHGGIGLGIERMMAIFLNLKSIKEAIAFPKNADGTCPLTGAPNYL